MNQLQTQIIVHNQQLISNTDFTQIKNLYRQRCVFCEPHEKKVIFETDNFWVTLDSSPLTEGHLLIHSKDHIGCTGEVSYEIFNELEELKENVGSILNDIYGSVSFYEHGRAGHCGITYGTDEKVCHHFHLHALPLKIDVSEIIESKFDVIKPAAFSEIPQLYEEFGHYLYFENSQGDMYYFPVNGELESHFLRTVISEALGKPEKADWEKFHDLSALNRCKSNIISNFSSKY
jgi:diadenosine tetraphosphate (Ap4A) HIT family hydrolase